MSQIPPLENFSAATTIPNLPTPPPPAKDFERPASPAAYSMAALFRRLENGNYAITGRTGDTWDIARAPNWRSNSKALDPFLLRANDMVGSVAFAVNVVNNAGGRLLYDIPALIDEGMKATLGVDFNEASLIARSATPGNPMDDLPLYLLARASEISKSAKTLVFREKVFLATERLGHIEAQHGWINLNLKKSLYFPDVDVPKLIQNAASSPKIPQRGGKFAQIVTAKELIGLDRQSGLPTKIYTVIRDAQGGVVTSHPGLPDPRFALP